MRPLLPPVKNSLRFFEGHSYPLIGGMLGMREEAARMRVGRALEKLRTRLERRGVVSTAAALGGGLSAHAIGAAPAGLAASVTIAATAAAVAGVTTPAAAGLFQFMSIAKMSATIAGAVAIIGAAWFVYQRGMAKEPEARRVSAAQPVAATPVKNDSAGGLDAVVEDHRKNRSAVSAATMEAEEKIAALRNVLTRLPEQSIPELRLATNGDWHAAVDGALETTEDYRRALGKIRAAAERRFAAILQPALRAHLTANGGRFPTSAIQLQALAGEGVDRAMFERYKVAPATEVRNVRVGGEWAITQSALVDSEFDSQSVIGPHRFGATNFTVVAQRELDIMMPVIRAYKAAHGERHADASQLVPYTTTPEQQTVVQKWLSKQAAR